jgi:hypothetical protein
MTIALGTIVSEIATGEPYHRITDGTNSVEHYAGTGSPEGVVTANAGSTFVDYATGAEYIKATGSGNTGWSLGGAYDIVDDLASRPSAASKANGYRVRVRTNNLTYVTYDGEYKIESLVSRLPGTIDLAPRSELVTGQVFYVGSLQTSYHWNGTSFEQVGCCPVTNEGPRIGGDFPPTTNISALVGEAFQASSGTFTYSSGSYPTEGETINLVRYTLNFSDPGFPNDGRVIVVEAAGHVAAPAVISDTGGTPSARLTTPQLSGTGERWSFTAGAANDIVLTGGGSISVTLYIEDTGANNDSDTL